MAGGEDSWKAQLEHQGYEVSCILKGLGECPAIQNLFVAHCGDAMASLPRGGKLYGVGVGPGDPELMTLKAVRVLREADVVMVPGTCKSDRTALRIAEGYLAGKTVETVETPMVRDKAVLEKAYETAAEQIIAHLNRGRQVASSPWATPRSIHLYVYPREGESPGLRRGGGARRHQLLRRRRKAQYVPVPGL